MRIIEQFIKEGAQDQVNVVSSAARRRASGISGHIRLLLR